MLKVQVGPRKVVYVETERDKKGVFCSFYADCTHENHLGDRYVHVLSNVPQKSVNSAIIDTTKCYFGYR